MTSSSAQGHTSFTLQFNLNKSIDAAATDVQTAITQATGSLPVDLPSPPTLSKTNPNDQAILYIALTTNSVTAGKLYDYGSTQVAQRISILPGVSRVDIFGTKSAIRIKLDPSAMAIRGITMDDLSTAIQEQARPTRPPASSTERTAPSYCSRRASLNQPPNTTT